MKVFMFPGQGSQAKGMGEPLFERFGKLAEEASEALGYSIRELCVDDPRGELNQTRFTQPALYVVNALSYYAKLEDCGLPPDFVVGHSLGEFNALLAAGCFDFVTGVKLVKKRGELMGRVGNGAMAAITNASRERVEAILAEHALANVGVANCNTPTQIVISGLADEIEKAKPLFQCGAMRFYPLNTSGAFHSRFMEPAREAFARFLKSFRFADPVLPVISNLSARPYEKRKIADGLAKQITSTVRWSDSIQYLIALAAERGEEITFDELGPDDVLTRLVYAIRLQTPGAAPQSATTVSGAPAEQVAIASAGTPVDEDAASHEGASEAARQAGANTLDTPPATAVDKVAAWNGRHPVGTKVKSLVFDYPDLETRTEAMVLFGHRAAVYMKGYNGYFDLDELAAM